MKAYRKAATIIDVAKAAEVSISTVSRVMNDYPHVRPELRSRVQHAMQELDFVPNRQARRLVGSRSGVVGLMVHALGTEYIAQVTKGIDERCTKQITTCCSTPRTGIQRRKSRLRNPSLRA